jgi:hypothetical protein
MDDSSRGQEYVIGVVGTPGKNHPCVTHLVEQPDPSPQSAAAHVKPFSRQLRDSQVLSSMGVSQSVAKLKESAHSVGGGGGGCMEEVTQQITQ